jgi:hypothetical protein
MRRYEGIRGIEHCMIETNKEIQSVGIPIVTAVAEYAFPQRDHQGGNDRLTGC